MKTLNFFRILIPTALAVIFVLGGTGKRAIAQDQQKNNKNEIHLKVIEDENGKRRTLDTVIKVEGNFDKEKFLKELH